MKADIFCKPGSEEIAKDVASFLEEMGVTAEIKAEIPDSCDFIVTVGGDGTILRVLQKLKECPPIFGINTGKVGLLTHANPDNYKERLASAIERMEVEEFMRVDCIYKEETMTALNEVALLTSMPARLVEFTVFVNGAEIENLRSDGMLIATSVGSTAYALSTGGPVVDPRMECLLIVPVAPFKLGWKPWVVSSSREVEVEVRVRDCLAIADGHETLKIKAGERLLFKKSDYPARFFKMSNRISRIVEMLRSIK